MYVIMIHYNYGSIKISQSMANSKRLTIEYNKINVI